MTAVQYDKTLQPIPVSDPHTSRILYIPPIQPEVEVQEVRVTHDQDTCAQTLGLQMDSQRRHESEVARAAEEAELMRQERRHTEVARRQQRRQAEAARRAAERAARATTRSYLRMMNCAHSEALFALGPGFCVSLRIRNRLQWFQFVRDDIETLCHPQFEILNSIVIPVLRYFCYYEPSYKLFFYWSFFFWYLFEGVFVTNWFHCSVQ